jgi:hypothetical protein
VVRSIGKGRRWLPNGRTDAIRQLLLFAAAYYLYRIVRGFVDGQVTAAFDHARGVIDLERGLHLFFEPGLQSWFAQRTWMIHFADIMYVNAHFIITLAFLVWRTSRATTRSTSPRAHGRDGSRAPATRCSPPARRS